MCAISQAHQAAGFDSPTQMAPVGTVLVGIRHAKCTAPACKAPVLIGDLSQMVGTVPDGLLGGRDRALLLLGFGGAFPRSELVGLDIADLDFRSDGLVVTLGRSKTDQEGAGRKVGIPFGSTPATCPVRAVRARLDACGISEGPLFRPVNRHGQLQAGRLSDEAVALVVKRYVAQIGKDGRNFARHSLRAGPATVAAIAGA